MKGNAKISRKEQGFTLLELIIVVVILGVLATLALPRFFSVVEGSRSAEALSILDQIRLSINRCGLWTGEVDNCGDFGKLDIDDPVNTPGAHFTYTIDSCYTNSSNLTEIKITAHRNALDGGNTGDTITLLESGTDSKVYLSGTGAFANIQ